jgi:hypothetical protein
MKRIPKKFETSYVFNDLMTSIFSLLIQIENIEKLNNNTQLPYLFTNKPITLTFNYLYIIHNKLYFKVKISILKQ